MLLHIPWFDPSVVAAIINGAATIVAGIFAAICAALIGKRIADRDRLQKLLNTSLSDIAFLLEVEKAHCAIHKQRDGQPHLMQARKAARNAGLSWSGRFTPGRASRSLSG